MTDHQLSTSDLAARADSHDSPETEQPMGGATRENAPSDHGSSAGMTEADSSLTRDPAAEDLGGTGTADRETADTAMNPAGDVGGMQTTHDTGGMQTPDTGADSESLFPHEQRERFTDRWQEIQTSFVDQPREAVADADSLVADLMQRLAASFSQERERLEAQWDRGDDVSTEDLRVALTRYRAFFDRLLAA